MHFVAVLSPHAPAAPARVNRACAWIPKMCVLTLELEQ